MKRVRVTRVCINSGCRVEFMGSKVASYCPKCAKEFSKTKYSVCYKRMNPIIPHFKE